jgi:cytochrome c biogenesis protein CcmG/thiol:disulfide interchange protein DsbE
VRRSVTWAVIAVCAALVGLLSYGLASSGGDTSIDEALSQGQRPEVAALEQPLPVLGDDSRSGSPADYAGKVVLVNFWASWCDPCKEELPLLQRTHEDMAREGGLVLGIDSRDLTDKALATVSRYELSFPNLRDRDAVLARKLGAVGYPETVVLDRQGRVAAMRRGPVTEQWLEQTLPPLLAETA